LPVLRIALFLYKSFETVYISKKTVKGNAESVPTTQASLKQRLHVEIFVKYVKHFISSNTL
jgi:hypothetical protein